MILLSTVCLSSPMSYYYVFLRWSQVASNSFKVYELLLPFSILSEIVPFIIVKVLTLWAFFNWDNWNYIFCIANFLRLKKDIIRITTIIIVVIKVCCGKTKWRYEIILHINFITSRVQRVSKFLSWRRLDIFMTFQRSLKRTFILKRFFTYST